MTMAYCGSLAPKKAREHLRPRVLNKWKQMPVEARASTAYFVCSVLQKGLSLITLPIFARLLSKVEYGQATIYESWTALLAIFITLNLGYGSFNTAMVKFEERRSQYLASVNGLVVMLSIVFIALYLPLQNVLNPLFELPTWIMLIMVAQIVGSSALQCWYARERFENHYRVVVFVTLAVAIAGVALALPCAVFAEEKGYARILGYAVPTIVAGICLIALLCVRERTFFNREFWSYALRFNLPLVPYYLSQMLFNQSDRIMISHMVGTDAAATYGIAYTFAMILAFVLNAVNGSYVPWLFKRIKAGESRKNRRVATSIAAVMAALLLCLIAAAPELVYILASNKYSDAKWAVPPIAMSLIFHFYSQLFVNFQFYHEERWMLVAGAAAAGVSNILLNFLLIPIFGYIVASYTTLFSFFLMAFMNWVMYKSILRRNNLPDEMVDYRSLCVITIGFMLAGFAFMALYGNLVARYAAIIVMTIAAFMCRRRIKRLFSNLRGFNG